MMAWPTEEQDSVSRNGAAAEAEDALVFSGRRSDSDDGAYDATETSGLLSQVDGVDGRDRWNGMADFEGLPWWRTPSVCLPPPPFSNQTAGI
jgi:hypothetical protein